MQPLLKVENLTKRYYRHGLASRRDSVPALDSISFSLLPGTTLALVGQSGSGKSTLALCLACLERPTSGSIWLEGRDLAAVSDKDLRAIRPQLQLIFQDPAASLNPQWTVEQIVREPLVVLRRGSRRDRNDLAIAALQQVGLSPELAGRKPGELSGGQRQRVAIARALVLTPRLLILDEVLSALDCSVQAQIVNLLVELQHSLGLTYLFITHDFPMAAHMSDEIAVLDRGRIVERATVEEIVRQPQHQSTRILLTATPRFTAAVAVSR